MQETKPSKHPCTLLKGSGPKKARSAPSALAQAHHVPEAAIDVVGAQDDSMAMERAKAFRNSRVRNKNAGSSCRSPVATVCQDRPVLGAQRPSRRHIYVPPNSGQALEMLVQACNRKSRCPERALTNAVSIPSLQELKSR